MAKDETKNGTTPPDEQAKEQNPKETTLRNRITELRKELASVTTELKHLKGSSDSKHEANGTSTQTDDAPAILPPGDKAGYLWKWQDRQIGWGGTKWDLRYVKLDGARGQLLYYKHHNTAENQPRYVLNLKDCAVRYDGSKPQKKRKLFSFGSSDKSAEDESPDYYYVFSIYHRRSDEDESKIVPLLRFSTESLAEKTQWIETISDACAYSRMRSEMTLDGSSSSASTAPSASDTPTLFKAQTFPPSAKKGTIPPIYFGDHYRTTSKSNTAAKSNPREISGYPPSRPMHQAAEPSYLSEDAPEQNYRGFLNLAAIILLISNFRLILDNIMKHGIVLFRLPDLTGYSEAPLSDFPLVTGEILLQIFVVTTLFIEKALASGMVRESVGMVLHGINANLAIIVPVAIVWNYMTSPIKGMFLLMQASIAWLKLLSYVHANSDYRKIGKEGYEDTVALIRNAEEVDITYPRNVTLRNIYYFVFAPTLTYQIAYPRSPRVRLFKVLTLLFRIWVTGAFHIFLVTQTIIPYLDKMVSDLEAGTFTTRSFAELILKLAIPNTYNWLVGFYLFFHLYLNLCAELLRFGDRIFYKDWWNSSEVGAYWRLWNVPVHYWLVRHVYYPVIRRGASQHVAMVIVFFVSAVMHEVMASVPFHMIRPWCFLGMMGQIPLVAMTKYLDKKFPGSSIGNVIFWLSFCVVGQPMALSFYAIDYWKLKVNVHDDISLSSHTEL